MQMITAGSWAAACSAHTFQGYKFCLVQRKDPSDCVTGPGCSDGLFDTLSHVHYSDTIVSKCFHVPSFQVTESVHDWQAGYMKSGVDMVQ